MTYAFSVAADATDGYAVTSALDAAHAALGDEASVVALAPEHLDPGVTYAFTVRVTDFAGGTSTASAVVEKTQHPTPTVRALGGSSRATRRSEPTRLEVEARAPSHACAALNASDVGAGMSFAWTLVGGPVLVSSDFPTTTARDAHLATTRTRALYVPPNVLRAGETYRWRLRTTLDVNPARFFTDTFVTLDVASSPLDVAAAAGTSVVAFHNAPLVLSVDARDPDDAADARGVPYPFTYAWSCATLVGDACDVNPARVPESFHSSAPTVTFPSGTFHVGDAFVFTANVAREPVAVGRDVTVSTTVRIVEGPATSTVAAAPTPAPSLRVEGPPGGIVAASSRVALRARVYDCAGDEGTCGVTWSCVEGDLTDPTALAAAVETGLENHILAVKPDALAPGTRYAFRASAGGSAAGLVADVVFDVNAPPRGGRVVAEFTASRADRPVADADADAVAALGFARVTIRASDWGDDAAHAPFSYEFYDVGADGSLAPLGPTTSSNAVDAWLPSGTRVIRARVADALGAATTADATVTVRPAPAPAPPPPPSPYPPPYTGTRSSGMVPPPPARRRQLLTASASAYDVAEALDYLEVLLRPATTTSDHARARAGGEGVRRQVRGDDPRRRRAGLRGFGSDRGVPRGGGARDSRREGRDGEDDAGRDDDAVRGGGADGGPDDDNRVDDGEPRRDVRGGGGRRDHAGPRRGDHRTGGFAMRGDAGE